MSRQNNHELQNLIRIQYPGVVNNVEKAIETLGGIKTLSQVYSTANRRLELRFRPKDFYCKPAYSTQISNFGLVLKIRVKKKKKNTNPSDKPVIVGTEIVGIVDTSYKFDIFSDFQYLPLAPKDEESPETSGLKCIHDDAVPTGIPDVEWLNEPCSYILTPAIFSRVEGPQTYNYRTSIMITEELSNKVMGKPRKKRLGNAVLVCYSNVGPMPTEPLPQALTALTLPEDIIQIVKKLFEEQPIWSKNGLVFATNLTFMQLKLILPCVAYYFLTGPWRALWSRFGFDPRKVPQSRIYQTMDYRMRNMGGIKGFIKSRINIIERATHLKMQPKVKKQHGDYFGQTVEYNKEEVSENCFIFKPDILPPRRQIFYQYCNLKVPEIEEMLARLGDVLPGSLCHERRGWLPAGFDDQCRDILNNYVAERMRQMIAEESINQASTSGEADFNEDLIDQEIEAEDANEDLADEVFSDDDEYDDIAE